MSDLPRNDGGWRVLPQDYLARRPPTYSSLRRPTSFYVAMRDGVRLAVDVYLPSDSDGSALAERLPATVIFTPYYRRFALRSYAPPSSEPSISAGRYRDFFVPRGYALVVVDVRGTGASFGVREGFRSPKERDDYREIVDWIVAQRWSSGAVCATGISYVGAAADFLASTGHPAVKAIAPLFSVWDTYSDHYYPGGMLLNHLAETYDELMVALDHGRGELLGQFAYYKDPHLSGPAPVDEDGDRVLLNAAITEHLGNFHMPDFIHEFAFKEEGLHYDPGFSSASFSPYAYCHGVRPDVAVYSVSVRTTISTRSPRTSQSTPCRAGWTARATPTARSRASSPCPTPSGACCWVRGITARGRMSAHRVRSQTPSFLCSRSCCDSSIIM